jgi:3-hydroxyacyl-[acyl-carrier protein] dehydratase/trans-2-decenoyl-[acyl-carrier protein] isomerase
MKKIQSSYDYDDLIISGEESLFGDGNAQLPLPPMLMFDRITHISNEGGAYGKGLITAELDINPDLWFFDCHFRNDPVMPGCLGLDAMWQLVGFYLGWGGAPGKGRALGVGGLKFSGQVTPDIKLVKYTIDLKRVIKRGNLALGIADGSLEADGQIFYKAEKLRVGVYITQEGDS